MTKNDLIKFESRVATLFNKGKLKELIHLSGGNETQLIQIFKKVKKEDWIISTHRNHYHYLLKGGSEKKLLKMIQNGRSMHICDKKLNFLATSIVGGGCSIAVGIAWALKEKQSTNRVWCFIGDAGEGEGSFYEAVRYVDGWKLPCIFVIEDNNLSVDTPKSERYGCSVMKWPDCVIRYNYVRKYPHVNTGKWSAHICK